MNQHQVNSDVLSNPPFLINLNEEDSNEQEDITCLVDIIITPYTTNIISCRQTAIASSVQFTICGRNYPQEC